MGRIKHLYNEKPKHKPKSVEKFVTNSIISQTESEKLIKNECVNLRVYIRSVYKRLCRHFNNFIDQTAEDAVCSTSMGLFEIGLRNDERKIGY